MSVLENVGVLVGIFSVTLHNLRIGYFRLNSHHAYFRSKASSEDILHTLLKIPTSKIYIDLENMGVVVGFSVLCSVESEITLG